MTLGPTVIPTHHGAHLVVRAKVSIQIVLRMDDVYGTEMYYHKIYSNQNPTVQVQYKSYSSSSPHDSLHIESICSPTQKQCACSLWGVFLLWFHF